MANLQPLSAASQAALYYARKRAKARANVTAGSGGLRVATSKPALGVTVTLKNGTIKVQ